ncbi:MAG: YhbY family RNA-binding protein [Casimicrobiaceae bacterium]
MEALLPAQRRALRARAHHLHPVVSIGQHGLTPAVLHELDVNLLAHELIKVRVFSGERDQRDALLERICDSLGAVPVQHIGKLLVVWRPAPDKAPAKTRAKVARPTAAPRATAATRPREPAPGEPRGKRRPAARPTHQTMAKSTPQARRPRTPTARTTARPPTAGARVPASGPKPPDSRARRRRRNG